MKYQFLIVLIVLIISACRNGDEYKQEAFTNPKQFTGTKQYSWEDTSRLDGYYGGTRKLNAQVWYPSNKVDSASKRTPYLLFGDKLYNKLESWTEEDFKAVQQIKTASFALAPIKTNRKGTPLLVFSPSLGGNQSFYTYYAEYFAKQGYIVMGINHLYESEAIVNKDSVYLGRSQFYDSLKALKIPQEISAEGYRETMGVRQKVLAEDIQFALNQLMADKAIGLSIDQTKIGVFGHSIGGAAAVFASILDSRIKAVINLDGTPPTVALNNGIDVPFLFIEDLTDYKNHQGYAKLHQRRNDFCEKNSADSWRVLIKGFNHNSFLDINYYLAEDSVMANSEKNNLDLTINYMNEFLSHYLLKNNKLNLAPIDSSNMEVIRFVK